MPPKKQTTLTIPKTRRHTKQLHKSKVISDDNSITQIGGSQGSTVATSTKKKLESEFMLKQHRNLRKIHYAEFF